MNLGLENKVTMVADSQLSIATAAAAALAKEGALLALSAPDNHHLRHVELELARLHIPQGQFRGVIADLDREQDVRRLVRETLNRQGDVGILVTVVQDQPVSPASLLDDDKIDPALNRNFRSAVHLTHEVVPHMKRLGGGRIINLVSLSALEVGPQGALSALSMAPLLAYFKGLASELAAARITVNNVIYGGIRSKETKESLRSSVLYELGANAGEADVEARVEAMMVDLEACSPMKRLGMPHEIGDVVCMIASEQASYITGSNIIVDGGIHHNYA